LPVALAWLAIHLATMVWRTPRTRRVAPLVLSVLGAIGMIAGSVAWSIPSLSLLGATMTIGAAIVNAGVPRAGMGVRTWARVRTLRTVVSVGPHNSRHLAS
jgi:hypothetical protein